MTALDRLLQGLRMRAECRVVANASPDREDLNAINKRFMDALSEIDLALKK